MPHETDTCVVGQAGRGRQRGAFAVAEDEPVGAQLARSGLLVAHAAVCRAADAPVVHRKAALHRTQAPRAATMQLPLAGSRQTLPKRELPDRHRRHTTALFSTSRIVIGSRHALGEDLHAIPGREEDRPVISRESRGFISLSRRSTGLR